MFIHFTDLTKSIGFYMIAFGLTLVVSLTSGQLGVDPGLSLMFTPLIAVVVMFFIVTRDGYWKESWLSLDLHRAGLRSWGLALLVSGLLHGLFHLPLMLLTPFYHRPGNRFIAVPLFLLALTVAGVWYGYLRITSQSVWPAAIAHMSFNITVEQLGTITIAVSPLAMEYLLGESGVLTLAGIILGVSLLVYRMNRQPKVLASA